MVNKWPIIKLKDIADIISGVSFSPNHIIKSSEGGGLRVLRGGNINANTILYKDDDVFLPAEYAANNASLRKGDTILTASTGSVEALGKSAYVVNDMHDTYVGAFMRIIRPKSKAYSDIINIYIQSNYFLSYVRSLAKGTSINNIAKNHLEQLPILMPDSSSLLCISRLHQNLADKIALNREINRNLPLAA